MTTTQKFWDRIAPKYAKTPIKNMDNYTHTLERTQSYLHAEDHVLELGCGTGSTALLLAPHVAQLMATDISGGMIEIAQSKCPDSSPHLNFASHDVETSCALYPNQDAVLAHNLLHLLEDVEGDIRAIHRSLKPGGLFISKSACLSDGGWYFRPLVKMMQWVGKAPHAAFFTVAELERMLEQADFEITETETSGGNPPVRYIVARKI